MAADHKSATARPSVTPRSTSPGIPVPGSPQRSRCAVYPPPPMAHRVTLIPGDGTGPELTEATRRVLEATGVVVRLGRPARPASTSWRRRAPRCPRRRSTRSSANKVALKGPITTPIGTGFRSVNVALRHELDLYACLRPCKTYEGVRSRYDNVDLVIVRENTEDLYAGIEYEAGTPDADERDRASSTSCRTKQIARRLRASRSSRSAARARSGSSASRSSTRATTAASGSRACTKANIMKFTDGLFLDVFREVAKEYPDIEPWENLVDAICMGLVQRPEEFDVLVLPNLYGDIVSDLTAGLVGGLGVAPGGEHRPRQPRSSRRRTARRRSTRARTRSTRRR